MAGNDPLSPWWSASRHADVRPFLNARGAIIRALRAWFAAEGFTEVETGILQISPGNETHLHAPRTELTGNGGERLERFLRTSPEFACKKLLAAGEEKIVEFARVFRDRERGDLHLPEFTMLEWYRANAAYDLAMADCAAVIVEAATTTGIRQFAFRGKVADPFAAPQFLTVAAAFERYAGIDLLATVNGSDGDRARLAAAGARKVRIADDDGRASTAPDARKQVVEASALVSPSEKNVGRSAAFHRLIDRDATRGMLREPDRQRLSNVTSRAAFRS